MWRHNICVEGRPQVKVYLITYVQINEATYNAWRVDHKSWSTNKDTHRYALQHIVRGGQTTNRGLPVKKYVEQ